VSVPELKKEDSHPEQRSIILFDSTTRFSSEEFVNRIFCMMAKLHRDLPIKKELLIFDLDGTLVNTLKDLAAAVNFALEKPGGNPVTVADVKKYVGDGARKLVERALRADAPQKLDAAMDLFYSHYGAHLSDHSTLYPGVLEILTHFSKIKKVVLTNKPQRFTTPLLEQLGLAEYFEFAIGGGAGIPLKPAPDGIYSILEKTNVSPDMAIIVGDSSTDILSGKAAGIHTCAAAYGYRPPAALSALKPDFLINNILELKKIIC